MNFLVKGLWTQGDLWYSFMSKKGHLNLLVTEVLKSSGSLKYMYMYYIAP
jgi:hypothetical protein